MIALEIMFKFQLFTLSQFIILRFEIYAPFSIQEILVRIRHADADVILAITDLLDFNVSGTGWYDNDFLVSGTIVFVVNAAGSLALSTVTVTNTATIFRSIGIHHPITTDFLKISVI